MLTEKRKKFLRQNKIFQFFFLILILVFIGFLIVSNLKIGQRREELREELQILKEKIISLEEEKSRLEAGISQTEKETYWEEKMRQEGYTRKGENPVVILPPPQGQKEKILPSQTLSEKFLGKIKDFFASLEVFLIRIFKKIGQ